MATLAQLKSKVLDVINDSNVRITSIVNYLNSGVTDIAAGMPSSLGSFLTPPLPKLFTIDTVNTETDAAYVEMPATYQRDLRFAASEDGTEIDIANSWIEFVETEPLLNRSGRIYEVIEHGGNLYYQGIPTASEDVTIHFYRMPVAMSDPTDEPDGIPSNFQEKLLVNYAAYRTFELLGKDQKAVYYENAFKKALYDFELSLPFDARSLSLA